MDWDTKGMPPVKRNAPVRAASSDSRYSLMDFKREFPDDAACLHFLWRNRFAQGADGHSAACPKCAQERRFHRLTGHPAYSCDTCGHHLHPTAGTIFEKSSTSLWLWFYAVFLTASTRNGLSAKQLERQIGVTYKTAWRMLNLIRNNLMTMDESPLAGKVEVDETYVSGRRRRAPDGRPGPRSHKTPVFGMVERQGRVTAVVVPDASSKTLMPHVQRRVLPATMVYTDEWRSCGSLTHHGYGHRRVRHSAQIYVDGDVHTNTIEGFFKLLRNGIRGTHHAVSRRWLQSYLDEFAWRYNERHNPRSMFNLLLQRAAA